MTLLAGAWIYRPAPAAPLKTAQAPQADAETRPVGALVVGMAPWKRSAEAAAPAAGPQPQAAAPVPAPQQTAALDARVETAEPAPAPQPEASAETAPSYPTVDVPLPPRRPPELKTLASRAPATLPELPGTPAPMRQAALPEQAPAAPAEAGGFFEKFFGGVQTAQPPAAAPQLQPRGRNARRQQQQQPAPVQQAMAYAPQEPALGGGILSSLTSAVSPSAPASPVASGPAPRAGAGTAVYNISTHTVYMPDGSRLEAHSGLREHLDDPRFVHVRMKGPTPPSVYALSPREALFHGVEALRLTPIGNNNIYGRAGLLAHTYMLGPNGDSNGCVSFRDYQAFLNAYKRGEVRRLVVVAGM